MAKQKIQPEIDDKKASPAADAATGPETPATGTGGAADAGGAVAAATPAEAAQTAAFDKAAAEAIAEISANKAAAEKAEKVKKTETPKALPILIVRGPAKGRWRSGFFFGPEPVEVNPADLTDDQVIGICSDPELTLIDMA